MSEAFARGTLSYSKVRALTRVATPDNEAALLAFALPATASRVEERCRQLRNVEPASTEESERVHRLRALRVFRDEDRGMLTFTVERGRAQAAHRAARDQARSLVARCRLRISRLHPHALRRRSPRAALLLLCTSHHRLVHERVDPAFGGDGSDGAVFAGRDDHDRSGRSVSGAGDVNGDGIDDLMIGATTADPGAIDDAGETYVVFGRRTAFPPMFELERLSPLSGGDGSEGFILAGVSKDDGSGSSVSGAGDLNSDGTDDLIIGAPAADPRGRMSAGTSYVIFGRR